MGKYDSTTGNLSTYFNGVKRANQVHSGGKIETTTWSIQIGAYSGNAGSGFNGSIDEVRIWNRTLSDGEISEMYQSNLKKFAPDSWSLYLNQSIVNETLNLTNLEDSPFSYSLCATNSSGTENCTDSRTITRVLSSTTITANFSSIHKTLPSRGVYGVNAQFTGNIDTDDDGVYDSTRNETWNRQEALNMLGNGFIRASGINPISSNYANTSDSSGVNYTGSFDYDTSVNKYACDNNMDILIQIRHIPTWLVDNSSGNCNGDTANEGNCTPSNYTKYANIINDTASRITNNFECIDNLYYEMLNEPYWSWGAENYTRHFNDTYWAVKNVDSRIKIGGPSGWYGSTPATSLTNYFLANATGNDFFSFHIYPSSYTSGSLSVYYDRILGNCTGANCSQIIMSEGQIHGDLNSNQSRTAEYGVNIAYAYYDMLMYSNNTIRLDYIGFQWQSLYGYSYFNNPSKHSTFPQLYEYVSEQGLDNKTRPTYYTPYNVTKHFATYHSAGSTVYETLSSQSAVKTVSSSDGTNFALSIINTDTEPKNISVNLGASGIDYLADLDGTLFDIGDSNNTGVLDSFGIQHLVTPSFKITEDGDFEIKDFEGTVLGTSNEVALNRISNTEVHIISNLTNSFASVVTIDVKNIDRLIKIIYTSDTGAFKQNIQRSQMTFSGSTVTFTINGIEKASASNVLMLGFGCSTPERGVLIVLKIILALAILIITLSLFYINGKLNDVTAGSIIMIFITVVILIAMASVIADSIFSYCGV